MEMSTRIRHTVCTHVPRRSPAPAVKKMVRSTAMTPALAIRPLRSADAGAGAAGWALGSQLCSGKSVRLSAREFDVMRFLLQTQDRILSKEMILARVWGYDSNAVENHVEVYVGFLRKKLSAINSNVRIEAVRRLGYRLEVAEA